MDLLRLNALRGTKTWFFHPLKVPPPPPPSKFLLKWPVPLLCFGWELTVHLRTEIPVLWTRPILTSNTKCPFKCKLLLPVSNNEVDVKVRSGFFWGTAEELNFSLGWGKSALLILLLFLRLQICLWKTFPCMKEERHLNFLWMWRRDINFWKTKWLYKCCSYNRWFTLWPDDAWLYRLRMIGISSSSQWRYHIHVVTNYLG